LAWWWVRSILHQLLQPAVFACKTLLWSFAEAGM
jgi:hypothetical protein